VTTYDAAIEYAVYEGGGWHIADWDGECFHVTSDWQQGDRWAPDQVQAVVPLTKPGGAP
jgi:hypothetical protein